MIGHFKDPCVFPMFPKSSIWDALFEEQPKELGVMFAGDSQ